MSSAGVITSPLLISTSGQRMPAVVAVAPAAPTAIAHVTAMEEPYRQSPPAQAPGVIGAVMQLPFLPAGPPQLARSVSAASARTGMCAPTAGTASPRVSAPGAGAGLPSQVDWRAHLTIEERCASRNKIREAYVRTCKSYDELLDTVVAIEEELLHMSSTGRLEYLKAGLEWDHRLQQKRKQLAGQVSFAKHVRTAAAPGGGAATNGSAAHISAASPELQGSPLLQQSVLPAVATNVAAPAQVKSAQHTLKSLADSELRDANCQSQRSTLKRPAEAIARGAGTDGESTTDSGSGRSNVEEAAAEKPKLEQPESDLIVKKAKVTGGSGSVSLGGSGTDTGAVGGPASNNSANAAAS